MTRHSWRVGTAAAMLLAATPAVMGQSRPATDIRHHAPQRATIDGSVVTAWNATALQFLTPATFASTRILAMTHLAIYDTVVAVTHHGRPYAIAASAPLDTSAEAAVSAAAHRVLVDQVPAQAAGLDAAFAAALAGIPDGAAKADGIAVGEFVASHILALRSGDVLGPASYSQSEAPGVWQPAGDGYNSGVAATTWPGLTPFALRQTSQFRPPPPPALTSREYALNEIECDADPRPDQRRLLLVRERPDTLQRAGAPAGHTAPAQSLRRGAVLRVVQRRPGGHLDGVLRYEVRLQFLEAYRRHPRCRG
jgi:hypothetical protein